MYDDKPGKLRQDMIRAILNKPLQNLETVQEASRIEDEGSVILRRQSSIFFEKDEASRSVEV